jgi:hypothetical protein
MSVICFASIILKIKEMKRTKSINFLLNTQLLRRVMGILWKLNGATAIVVANAAKSNSLKGKHWYSRRCAKCRYEESATAHTMFHQLKFPIQSAFQIVYLLSTMKKGLSIYEIARQFGIHQETAWFFRRKIQQAIQSLNDTRLKKHVEVDETLIGGFEVGGYGRKKGKKRNVQIALEIECPDEGRKPFIKRAKAMVIKDSSGETIKEALNIMVDKEAVITTDFWSGYQKAAKEWFHNRELSEKGSNFKELHYFIFNLKNWIRGTHHKVSGEHTQSYLDEYLFRFNRRNFYAQNPVHLLSVMIFVPIIQYSQLIAL